VLSSLGSTAVTQSRYDLSPSGSAGGVHDRVNSDGPVFKSFLDAGGAGNSTRQKSQAAIRLLNKAPCCDSCQVPKPHPPYICYLDDGKNCGENAAPALHSAASSTSVSSLCCIAGGFNDYSTHV